MAASPDGIVLEGATQSGTIKIKCPFSCRKLTVQDGCRELKSFFCELVNNEVRLKRNHQYYQGAMALAKVQWCDCIVWTMNDMTVERVEVFWEDCQSRLKSIYMNYILPEFIYPKHHLSNLAINQYPVPP